jgi:VWFA-related protein
MKNMVRFSVLVVLALAAALTVPAGQNPPTPAQQQQPPNPDEFVYRVRVDLVLLNVAVTDRGGKYIKGLRPSDFRIFEDGIPQRMALFSEGGGLMETLLKPGEVPAGANAPEPPSPPELGQPKIQAASGTGSNVFILFDTSNFMYKAFALAEDAIADFIRNLDPQDSVAVYGFSRNLMRASQLSRDRDQALSGLRHAVAGDDTALYNTLLLTLQDARQVTGRKVVVVFSNGPDNGSMISPEAVREMAESEGIPIYMISTQDATKDEISATVFRRITERTGGKAYFARNWRAQADAFASIRDDLAHLYLLSYYPASNSNLGWRKITVELNGDNAKKFRIRTRTGYRPRLRSDVPAGSN